MSTQRKANGKRDIVETSEIGPLTIYVDPYSSKCRQCKVHQTIDISREDSESLNQWLCAKKLTRANERLLESTSNAIVRALKSSTEVRIPSDFSQSDGLLLKDLGLIRLRKEQEAHDLHNEASD